MSDVKVRSVDRKIVQFENYIFLVDIAFIENGTYMCRGIDIDHKQQTDWVHIHDDNPAFKFGDYLKLFVNGEV